MAENEERLAHLESWRDGHERVCAERQETIRRALGRNDTDHSEMKTMVKSVSARLWALILTVSTGVVVAVVAAGIRLMG